MTPQPTTDLETTANPAVTAVAPTIASLTPTVRSLTGIPAPALSSEPSLPEAVGVGWTKAQRKCQGERARAAVGSSSATDRGGASSAIDRVPGSDITRILIYCHDAIGDHLWDRDHPWACRRPEPDPGRPGGHPRWPPSHLRAPRESDKADRLDVLMSVLEDEYRAASRSWRLGEEGGSRG